MQQKPKKILEVSRILEMRDVESSFEGKQGGE